MRSRTMLLELDDELRLRRHERGALPGCLHEPPEAGGPVCQAEVLYQL